MKISARTFFLLLLTFASLPGFAQHEFAQTQKNPGNTLSDGKTVVASLNDRHITKEEVDGLIGSQLFELQEKIYNLRKAAIDKLLTGILLEEEARSRGITVEELQRQFIPENPPIEPDRIDEAYLENAGAVSGMNEAEARQRIKLDLEAQLKMKEYKAAIDSLRNKARITIFITAPIAPRMSLSPDGPVRGNKDAAITIIEFSDFQCPYCKQATAILDQVLQSYDGEVRLVFKHMPLGIHPEALNAARAAYCADRQGQFWGYHDRLFESGQLDIESLRQQAVRIGLKTTEFDRCLESDGSRAAVLADMLQAKRANVQGTPSFFVNGRLLRGARGIEDFKKVIDEELERTRKENRTKVNGAPK